MLPRGGDSYGRRGGYGDSGSAARKVDAPATYDSSGVGFISACPDPENAGPKYAVLSDTNGDGRNDRCFQSGYQEKGVAGDLEFHARLNNTTTAGRQSVVWCYDPDRDGCSDEREGSRHDQLDRLGPRTAASRVRAAGWRGDHLLHS